MRNEIIGIVGVFAFTLFLFVLRSFCLPRRHAKERNVAPAKSRELHAIDKSADPDDNWLLWSEYLRGEAGSSDRGDDGMPNLANR